MNRNTKRNSPSPSRQIERGRSDCTSVVSLERMSNWREIIKAQEDELKRMEEMDAALNEDQEDLDLNIKAIFKGSRITAATSRANSTGKSSGYDHAGINEENLTKKSHQSERSNPVSSSQKHQKVSSRITSAYVENDNEDDEDEPEPLPTSRSEHSILSPSAAALKNLDAKQAPDTTARIQKARLKGLTKQLEESKELRKQLMEQMNDLQRQLKSERDDNKQLRKR
jgi:hypothetical protein